MECACKEQIRAHRGLVDVGFVHVDSVAVYVCGSKHSAPGKAYTGGIVCGSPGLFLRSTAICFLFFLKSATQLAA